MRCSFELVHSIQDIAYVKFDELKKVEDFQRFKEIEGDTNGAQLAAKGFSNRSPEQVCGLGIYSMPQPGDELHSI